MPKNKDIGMYDFGGMFAQTYEEECECGRTIKVSTQEDDRPEYTTEVYVKCKCGSSVSFVLPVN